MGSLRSVRFRTKGAREDPLVKFWTMSMLLVISGYVYLYMSGQGRETWLVVTRNFWGIAFAVVVLWLFGLVAYLKNVTFNSIELVIFLALVLGTAYPTTALGYLFFTDLGDIEIINTEAKELSWKERFIVEADDEDDSDDEYGPYFTLKTTMTTTFGREVEFTEYLTGAEAKEVWDSYVNLWGGQGRVTSSINWDADAPDTGFAHYGDGDSTAEIHTITWDGREETRVPVSLSHRYANYLKGSDSVAKLRGVMGGFEDLLVEYPEITCRSDGLGPIEFDRVIEVNTSVPGNFHEILDKELDEALKPLGSKRECNVVVYVVGTTDQGFFSALREKWHEGKKNDIVCVIGYTNNCIQWTRVLAWAKYSLFVEKLQGSIRDLQTLTGNGKQLAKIICEQIDAPGKAGFVRMPMAEKEYLAAGIDMPFLIKLLVAFCTWIVLLPTLGLILRS